MQVPYELQYPARPDMAGSALQVWSAPGVQAGGGKATSMAGASASAASTGATSTGASPCPSQPSRARRITNERLTRLAYTDRRERGGDGAQLVRAGGYRQITACRSASSPPAVADPTACPLLL